MRSALYPRFVPFGRFWPVVVVPGLVFLGRYSASVNSPPIPRAARAEHPLDPILAMDHWEQALAAAQRRTELKVRLAHKVARGEMDQLTAAERFRDLNETNPDFNWSQFRKLFSAPSDKERSCLQVIGFVEMTLESKPEQARAQRQRLEAELQQARHRSP